MKIKKGILLLQMGGPSSLANVENFLFNLFRDPYIIQLPYFLRPFQSILAKFIASRRSSKVARSYKKIGGASPILFETQCQAKSLAKFLADEYKVYIAMRYSAPFLKDSIGALQELDELVVIPLYPQYSTATSGSSIAECKAMFKQYKLRAQISYVEFWYDHPLFVQLIQERIQKAACGLNRPYVLFSAHGLPVQYIKKGDPYQKQIENNVTLVMQHLPNYDYSIAYQSRVGPVEWLKPYTDEIIVKLAQQGIKDLIIVPISFVGDHIETLEEIGMQYQELALQNGIINFRVTRLPKANPLFIRALVDLVNNASTNLQSSSISDSTPVFN